MYEKMSPASRWIAFFSLLAATLATIYLTSRGLDAAGIKPLRIELCHTTDGAQSLLNEWHDHLDILQTSTWWDFLFILAYTPSLMFLCAAAARSFGSIGNAFGDWSYRLGPRLCRAMVLAGVCDFIEDVGIFRVISQNGAQPWPAMTATAAAVKWLIVLFAVVYAGIGILAAAFHMSGSVMRARSAH